MDLSRKWLNEFVDVSDISDKEYAHRLTMSGSIVEGITDLGAEIVNVVVGRVTAMERHPDSDHLWVCQVDVAKEEDIQIVTGAQNVSVGDLVPVALHKSILPGGVKITRGKLRGIMSNGMMCSLGELGLDLHNFPYAIEDGIFILQEDCKPGDDIRGVIGLDDHVAEFEITNNRADCLSVIGLARETAAVFERPLKLHTPQVNGSGGDINDHLSVKITSELCPRYAARVVTDVKIEPSPLWLRERLHASGIRPINNIVDITNYVMLEYGQPMHSFDYSCLDGGKIVVRTAEEGESIDTLDSVKRPLTKGMLVIADESKPVGVAGVMGGANSEITENTKTVVFESANFNGTSIRRTAIALSMRTDSSSRFEKGLDPENTIPAVQRACELVEILGAGKVVDGIIDINNAEYKPVTLPLEPDKINALLGTDISVDYMIKALELLGFQVDGMMITVPSWRTDVSRMADIAEEVARMYGYDKIPTTLVRGEATVGGRSGREKHERTAGQLCRSLGYSEILTYSFISPSYYDKIALPSDSPLRDSLSILNPLGEDTSIMRTVSLPSMLETISRNYNNRNASARLYELARVYRKSQEKLPTEPKILTIGAYGDGMDFFDLKGDIDAIISGLGLSSVKYQAEHENPSYHPGQCANIKVDGVTIGVLGQIHPSILANYDIDVPVFTAELDYETIYSMSSDKEVKYVPLPRFPASTRDIAVVCDATIPAGELIDCITAAGGKLLSEAKIFDVYSGGQIPSGKKSVAISLIFRKNDSTLTDTEVGESVSNILKVLEESFGAVLR